VELEIKRIFGIFAGVAALVSFTNAVLAQTPLGTSFTYQGELTNAAAPATGLHDLRFRLYDAQTGGLQVGSTLCADNVNVAAGRFSATLDFGAQFTGQQRWLEIEVRSDAGLDCGDATGMVVLSPRQPLSATPNALFALNAGTATNAAQLNGQAGSFYQNAANLTGTIPGARLAGTYAGLLTFNNPGNLLQGRTRASERA